MISTTIRFVLSAAALLAFSPAVLAQTPDGETPAMEESCIKYEGQGARHGLCIAFCEAQDCKGKMKYEDPSCDRIVDNFVKYSVKGGYAKGSKPARIDCTQTACSKEDEAYCNAREVSLLNPETKECQSFCTVSFEGFSDTNPPLPICEKIKLPEWNKCVIEEPI